MQSGGSSNAAVSTKTNSSSFDDLSQTTVVHALMAILVDDKQPDMHLQTLWKRVEGSQKYLPALPGRHIITESQRWVELNAATWKPRRRVALVLLNDHLLIARSEQYTAWAISPNDRSGGNKAYGYWPSRWPWQQQQH